MIAVRENRMGNLETRATLDTSHRTKTNKQKKAQHRTMKRLPTLNPGEGYKANSKKTL